VSGKKEGPELLALSRTYFRYLVGVTLIESRDTVGDQEEIREIQRLHVFEGPLEPLEDREAVD